MNKFKNMLRSKNFVIGTSLALLASFLVPAPAHAANYTVTYSNAGYSSGTAPNTATVAEGATYTTVSSTTLVKTGFSFNGWNTAENAAGTSYAAGGTFTMPAANVTLYPVWSGTITYNANGGSGAPAVATQAFDLGKTVTLTTAGTLTRSTYTFLGWKTSVAATSHTSGGGSYATTGLTAGPTLYAAWGRTFSFNANGATVGVTPSSREWAELNTGADLTGVGTDLKKRGYDFAGWSASIGGPLVSTSFTPTSSGQVLYAAWIAQPTKRTFGFNISAKKTTLTSAAETLLTDFAKTFDQTALFAKTNIQIFIGSTRHSSTKAKLGQDRINTVIKFLKSKGVTAKFLWSNDVRKLGKANDSSNNRMRIIAKWTN